jgi:hypothetical protein
MLPQDLAGGERVEVLRGGDPRDVEIALEVLDLRVRVREQAVDEVLAVQLAVLGADAMLGFQQR